MGDDDRRIYDMVARRFLAVFHPEASSRTRASRRRSPSTSSARAARSSSSRAGAASTASSPTTSSARDEEDEGRDQPLPKLEKGEGVDTRDIEVLAKETKPPRRYSDASLLGAMETAGKLVDDDELREAMKESGIGTPATRAAIIERLIDVGYVERDGRALVADREGHERHPPARRPPADLAVADRRLGAAPGRDRGTARSSAQAFMADIAKFAGFTVGDLDAKLKDVRIPRANLGPCPVCGRDIVENRKGYSCWAREDPGCGFVIWKSKAGKNLPPAVAKELIATGRTAKQVTGFKGRSGRSFRARLALDAERRGQVARRVRRAVGQGGLQGGPGR